MFFVDRFIHSSILIYYSSFVSYEKGGEVMKSCFPAILLLVLAVSSPADAENFQPTLLKLSYEEILRYDFDGSPIDIPFTVNGQPAGVLFALFTKDKADDIAQTTNGYLDWHTVNGVDTCIYYSDLKTVPIGPNFITWDGRDQDGGVVPKGAYTYYLWAFDNQGSKQLMGKALHSGWGFDITTNVQEIDEDGLPMNNPIWYRHINRWEIGSDPEDATQLIATTITLDESWEIYGDTVLQKDDFDYQYIRVGNRDSRQGSIQKMKFVGGGDAEIVEDWGAEAPFATIFNTMGGTSAGIASDGDYLFTTDENHFTSNDADSDFYIYDMDGYLIDEIDISLWWSSAEDFAKDAQMNGGPNNFECRHGKIVLNCHCNCLNQMYDPARYLKSGEREDLLVWTNDNGDYTLDHNWEATADKKWVCNDYNVGPYKYCVSTDDNLFAAVCSYDIGTTSFGLLAPDGTGLGYYTFAGDTAGQKKGEIFIDSGTPYDGLYTDNEHLGGYFSPIYDYKGIFFLGHDSVKGLITSVSDPLDVSELPSEFALSQNHPNPFNPVTTIPFSLAEDSEITLVVYNIAGEKIATLAEGQFSAGRHNIDWNAGEFGSGIYFCRLNAGKFEQTRKMTVVK